ncbi:hypothetical protein MRX96_009978 [Rhipicephalus microplus]
MLNATADSSALSSPNTSSRYGLTKLCPNIQSRELYEVHANVSPLQGSTSYCGEDLQGSIQEPLSLQKTSQYPTKGCSEGRLPAAAAELRRTVHIAFPFQLPLSKPGAIYEPSMSSAEPGSKPVLEQASRTES